MDSIAKEVDSDRVLPRHHLYGNLARKKHSPRRTLQQHYAHGHLVILGRWVFVMREVPL